jgi:hypothetical protein
VRGKGLEESLVHELFKDPTWEEEGMRRVSAILAGLFLCAFLVGAGAAEAEQTGTLEMATSPQVSKNRPLELPEGVTATPKVRGVTLQWKPVPRSSGYRIYWEEEGPVSRRSDRLAEVAADQSSLQVEDLVPGVLYNFRVCAMHASREEWLSRQVGAKPLEELERKPDDAAP